MALMPPVSATSSAGRPSASSLPASAACSRRATAVEPVKSTPRTRASATSAAPTVSPAPGRNCSAAPGTPARCSRRTACAATSGVCAAGLASTVQPAASAAATCPQKMASGKFHGLMQTTGPTARGCRVPGATVSSRRACAA